MFTKISIFGDTHISEYNETAKKVQKAFEVHGSEEWVVLNFTYSVIFVDLVIVRKCGILFLDYNQTYSYQQLK